MTVLKNLSHYSLVLALAVSLVTPLSAQDDDDWDDDWGEEQSGIELHGFIETAAGFRLQNDPVLHGKDTTLGDLRLRLETSYEFGKAALSIKADGWYDHAMGDINANIRDLTLSLPLSDSIDLKAGRQILTWGTGDFLFINDQFGKNWRAFFSGQDDEYLKRASNSIKASWYQGDMNFDVVWTPVFEPDRYINGELFSFFSPQEGQNIAPAFKAIEPDESLTAGELSARFKLQAGSTEYALYAYRGYSGTPLATSTFGQPAFARMQTFGASMTRPLGGGLLNTEIGYQNTLESDTSSVIDKQIKLLVGYEHELVKNLTLSGQYYLEYTPDHDLLSDAMASGGTPTEFIPDRARHVLTLRATYMTNRNDTRWSLFSFYSPSDQDGYIRPKISHRLNDVWSVSAGANIFFGKKAHSFFGQFKQASNGFLRVRYGF